MKITNLILFFTLIINLLFITNPVFSYTFSENVNINWKTGVISSIAEYSIKFNSQGIPINISGEKSYSINKIRMQAYKQARSNAIEYMVSSIRNIKVDNYHLFKDILINSTYTQQRFSELIENMIKTEQYPTGFYSAKCHAKLELAQLFLTLPFKFPNNDFPKFDIIKFETEYTSLVIDTRGFNLKPMIFPAIYDENGLEIYNRYYIDIEYGKKYGIVSYVYNESEINNSKRTGKLPFYTIAIKQTNGNPVIAFKDVKKIFGSNKTLNNLKQCKVIFIIDKENKANNNK